MSGERPTPPNGVQLIDRSQWRAIAAVGFVAAVALCVAVLAVVIGVEAWRRPTSQPLAPALHVACPAAPACPAIPPCAACPACPSPRSSHRD